LTMTGLSLKSISKGLPDLAGEGMMPVLFVGHGNPMNAILENDITRNWGEMSRGLNPKAILCISAHWQTRGTFVTAMEKPRTIHDFYGFPPALFETQYPAPGSPAAAKEAIDLVRDFTVKEDHEWGLDHGTWSVLIKMFPKADVPVFQMSLDYGLDFGSHYELAKQMVDLRKKGVMIVGSGNLVHNLQLAKWGEGDPYDWAVEFDQKVKNLIDRDDHGPLIEYQKLGQEAKLSVPTAEHYLPMLYSLGLKSQQDQITYFNETTVMGSISMRSFVLG